MAAFSSFHVSAVPQVLATILTPVSRTYGSLELPKLAQFGSDLADFAAETQCSTVILDLSGVTQHGSGFLSELIEFANDLQQRAIDLIVAGDQTGLVRLVGSAAWCQLADDLVDALNVCGGALVAA